MLIRDAVDADLPAIVEIYNATIPSRQVTADTEPVTVDQRSTWFQDHSADQHPLWVVEQDGAIAAWLSFQAFYGRPAYQITAELSIYVAPSHRQQGIGQRLLHQAIQQSPRLGIQNLLGFIFGHNQPSLRLFEKFGFQRWGHLPNVAELDGIQRDLVIMGLAVPQETRSVGKLG